MRDLNTEKILKDLNMMLGGKGPLRCPVCRGASFVVLDRPLRTQTGYLIADAQVVELVYAVCDGCHHILQFHAQERWYSDYVEIGEDGEGLNEEDVSHEKTKSSVKEALQEMAEEPNDPEEGDLESMLSEISSPIEPPTKPKKPRGRPRKKPLPDPDDHEKAQIEEARRRAELEDLDVFDD